MTAYYNENDSFAAEWLRNLIKAGHIADGVVDERSIVDVEPADLADYTQCHFFAGVGVWSLALRNAGWSDDRPIWTGSCPCQPFSSAGKGSGFDDERHLWPAFEWLIRQCHPATIIGEQVASKDADSWVDLVQTDMEALGYTFGAVPFPAASIGAPHIRDRLYWVAYSNQHGCPSLPVDRGNDTQHHAESCGESSGMGNAHSESTRRHTGGAHAAQAGHGAQSGNDYRSWNAGGDVHGLADANSGQHGTLSSRPDQRGLPQGDGRRVEEQRAAGPTNGFWRAADWLGCTDGKWRPVEPGTFPLAHGVASRVGRLRAYGNAINAEQARVFIEAVMECIPQC